MSQWTAMRYVLISDFIETNFSYSNLELETITIFFGMHYFVT